MTMLRKDAGSFFSNSCNRITEFFLYFLFVYLRTYWEFCGFFFCLFGFGFVGFLWCFFLVFLIPIKMLQAVAGSGILLGFINLLQVVKFIWPALYCLSKSYFLIE